MDANIIFGSVFDDEMENKLKITVIATGFEHEVREERLSPMPQPARIKEEEEVSLAARQTPLLSHPNRSGSESDLDVPAFLRQEV